MSAPAAGRRPVTNRALAKLIRPPARRFRNLGGGVQIGLPCYARSARARGLRPDRAWPTPPDRATGRRTAPCPPCALPSTALDLLSPLPPLGAICAVLPIWTLNS